MIYNHFLEQNRHFNHRFSEGYQPTLFTLATKSQKKVFPSTQVGNVKLMCVEVGYLKSVKSTNTDDS